jgi:hypothetical protein
MIDLDGFLDELYPYIKDYSGVEQLILGTKDVKPELMKYPRGRIGFTTKYDAQPRQSFITLRKVVPSEEIEFENDIEYTYIINFDTTLSLNFYGEDVDVYVNKARQWFMINKLNREFLNNYGKAVIKEITPTQNRKTFIETEYEDRQGFDVILGFSDKVVVTEKTIETVQFNMNGESFEVDI